jgi:hypothetical protein
LREGEFILRPLAINYLQSPHDTWSCEFTYQNLEQIIPNWTHDALQILYDPFVSLAVNECLIWMGMDKGAEEVLPS